MLNYHIGSSRLASILILTSASCCASDYCGQGLDTLNQLKHQAAAYAAGLDYRSTVARTLSYAEMGELCAESQVTTIKREAALQTLIEEQAKAYGRGDSTEARRLATHEPKLDLSELVQQ